MWFPLGIAVKVSDFERNQDPKIRGEQLTASGEQTQGGISHRLLLSLVFQIDTSFKIENFYGSNT